MASIKEIKVLFEKEIKKYNEKIKDVLEKSKEHELLLVY